MPERVVPASHRQKPRPGRNGAMRAVRAPMSCESLCTSSRSWRTLCWTRLSSRCAIDSFLGATSLLAMARKCDCEFWVPADGKMAVITDSCVLTRLYEGSLDHEGARHGAAGICRSQLHTGWYTHTWRLRQRSGHGRTGCCGILQEERGFMIQSYEAIAWC